MTRFIYVLDDAQRILQVGGGWDSAAQEHGAERCWSHNLIGHSIWSFVQGEGLRSCLNALFFVCRSQQRAIRLPYMLVRDQEVSACEMILTPLAYGAVQVENDIRIMERTLERPIPSPACRCELCLNRVEAVLSTQASSGQICSDCKQRVSNLLQTPTPHQAETQRPAQDSRPPVRLRSV